MLAHNFRRIISLSGKQQVTVLPLYVFAWFCVRMNTTLNITGYRYAATGYYDFDELQQIQSGFVDEKNINSYHQRSRISTTISQDLQDWGQLYLSASKDQYWDTADGYNLSASYSLPFRYISAMLSLGYNKSPYYQ